MKARATPDLLVVNHWVFLYLLTIRRYEYVLIILQKNIIFFHKIFENRHLVCVTISTKCNYIVLGVVKP